MNEIHSTPQATTTADTLVAHVLQRMFPKAIVIGEQRGHTVGSCRLDQRSPPHAQLSKKKTIPVDGLMLVTVSTINALGRCRWFLMETGEVYVVIKMSPAQEGCPYSEMAQCVGSAVTEREKFELRQHFQKHVATLNGGSVDAPASFYPGRGH